jgi:hypothetical protein
MHGQNLNGGRHESGVFDAVRERADGVGGRATAREERSTDAETAAEAARETAYRLKSVRGLELLCAGGAEGPDVVRDIVGRQLELLYSLALGGGGLQHVELRMGVQGDGDDHLQLALVARAEAGDDDAQTAVTDVGALLRAGLPEYWFETVPARSLAPCLSHPLPHRVALRRVEREVVLLAGGDRDGASVVRWCPPLRPGGETLSRVARLLLEQPVPTALSVRLTPTALTPDEVAHRRAQVAALQVLRNTPPTSVAERARYEELLSLRHERAAELAALLSHQLDELEAGCFELEAHISSARPLPAALVAAICSLGRGASASSAAGAAGGDSRDAATRDASGAWQPVPVEPGDPTPRRGSLVTAGEALTLFKLPLPLAGGFPGVSTERSRTLVPAAKVAQRGFVLGDSRTSRGQRPVALSDDTRARHIYIAGQTGGGKSTLIEWLALQDMLARRGLMLLDPHGDLHEAVLARVPRHRLADVIVIDPADRDFPIGLNLLEFRDEQERHFLVQELAAMLVNIAENPDFAGPMFHHWLRNATLLVTANPDDPGTLAELPRLYANPDFHKRWLPHVTDPMVRNYWEEEFKRTSDFHRSEAMGYMLSKLTPLLSDPTLRNILGQRRSSIDFDAAMAEGKILLVNLSKGQLGDASARLLGMTLVARLTSAAMRRGRLPKAQRTPFALYVDEFHNLATSGFSTLLSEARKFGLELVLANQFVSQIEQASWARHQYGAVSKALLGNVGTVIAFRTGSEDAALLEDLITPQLGRADLVNLPNFRAIVSTLVDGAKSAPFTIDTRPSPPIGPDAAGADAVRAASRQRYGRPRAEVERAIGESLTWK